LVIQQVDYNSVQLAAGQILCLSWWNDILCFSCLSRRVAGTGWKALYANA